MTIYRTTGKRKKIKNTIVQHETHTVHSEKSIVRNNSENYITAMTSTGTQQLVKGERAKRQFFYFSDELKQNLYVNFNHCEFN